MTSRDKRKEKAEDKERKEVGSEECSVVCVPVLLVCSDAAQSSEGVSSYQEMLAAVDRDGVDERGEKKRIGWVVTVREFKKMKERC